MSQPDERPALGLRERKKAKTRAAIQQQALRLFREQGYDATTVEQIAAAVEISPSTFFRYFPTKEAVVLWDDIDPLLFAAFDAQPPEMGPIQALRVALREVFATLPARDIDQQWERGRLIFAVPDLRRHMLDQFLGLIDEFVQHVAPRMGRPPDDIAARAITGAMIGALYAVVVTVLTDPRADYITVIDASLASLESGAPR